MNSNGYKQTLLKRRDRVADDLDEANPNELANLTGEMTIRRTDEIDHIVLVVANCGLKPEPANTYLPHDDGQRFSIEFSAE